MSMSTQEVSIAVYPNKVAALANAQSMRNNGFEVAEVMQVTDALSWDDFTVTPARSEGANTPGWLVIGRR